MKISSFFVILSAITFLNASTIYVLKATFIDKATRYYVGKTDDLDRRLEAHKTTDKYWLHGANDISVQWTGKDTDICSFDPTQAEENVFMLVVRQFGHIEKEESGLNVRGASYTRPKLSPLDKRTIARLIAHALDLCFNCGLPHYATPNCRHKTLELTNKFLDDVKTHTYNSATIRLLVTKDDKDEWAEIHRWLDELRDELKRQ